MCRLALFLLIIGIVHQANGEVCTWSWTAPSGTNTLTRSNGAPVKVTASVNDDLTSGDKLTWKLTPTSGTAVTLATVTYTTSYAVTDDAGGHVATQTKGADANTNSVYNLEYPSAGVLIADNGKVISLELDGCDTGSTTFTGITLDVKYCTDTYATATTTDTTDTSYQGTKEFTCTKDTNVKFTATCQADASWSPQYEACPCSSAGVREVSMLALLMLLCSALTSTHLM